MAADTSADQGASPAPSGSSATSSTAASIKSSSLQRGKACLRCRKRKMRCDGTKPACSQCYKAKKGDCCVYDDGKGKTRTQVLRESIARLEERIRELQDPEYAAASVTLFDPHMHARQLSGSSSSSSADSPKSTVLSVHSPYLDLSSPSPQPGWQRLSVSSPLPFVDPFAFEEPPMELAQMLLEIFLPHRYQCGLDIHVERLRDSLLSSPMDRPHPVLMNSIYLWSCYLSRPGSLSDHESQYLAMTLRALPEALQQNRIVDVVRASCLLAQYFLSNGRYAEGDYHLSTAASLATSYGLHRLSSPNSLDAFGSSFGPSPLQLEPAKDVVEEGERILAFWQVFNLDRCWSVALRRPTSLPDYEGSRIDTPWPQNMFEYEAGNIDGAMNDSTVQRFLASPDQTTGVMGGFSPSALRAKASALYDSAARVSASWSQHFTQPEAFDANFRAFEFALTRFIPMLSPLQQLDAVVPEDKYAYMAMHALVHGAMIQLHERFATKNPASHEKCVRAARNTVAVIRHALDTDYDFLEPVVGSCLLAAGHILLREIARIKSNWPMIQDIDVYAEMDTVIFAMTKLGTRFPIFNYQVTELQEMLASN